MAAAAGEGIQGAFAAAAHLASSAFASQGQVAAGMEAFAAEVPWGGCSIVVLGLAIAGTSV